MELKEQGFWLGDWFTNFKTYNVGDCLHGDSKGVGLSLHLGFSTSWTYYRNRASKVWKLWKVVLWTTTSFPPDERFL